MYEQQLLNTACLARIEPMSSLTLLSQLWSERMASLSTVQPEMVVGVVWVCVCVGGCHTERTRV